MSTNTTGRMRYDRLAGVIHGHVAKLRPTPTSVGELLVFFDAPDNSETRAAIATALNDAGLTVRPALTPDVALTTKIAFDRAPASHDRVKTIGEAVSGMDVFTAGAFAGLALIIVGSLGPWATSPLSSASGISGDGKWAAALAILGIIGLAAQAPPAAGIASGLVLAIGMIDAIDIHQTLANVTILGTQVDHVGWGVYAVIAGAVITIVALFSKARMDRGRSPAIQGP